ncbi:dynein light chain Tctex-type 5 [Rhincodon typus]|uniref:dynein light chain Tctex-type 5 n=1 Tax=Rhincodon typus TaxID=259920 RepID=UPI0009A3152B|nr:dynein light chain Tctex-type 5 [Rhincodon typus]XP_020368380.1 dynein light chain Tctex-type 5 [Rhincodon typus]XP_048458245.1 dynein light chain Tctex-type 5 [Rhincodon typus]
MTAKQMPLSQEALAQFNQALSEHNLGQCPHTSSISTHRSTQSVNVHASKHHLQQKNIDGRSHVPSRRSSIISNVNASFSRKGSMMQGKRHSLSWMTSGQVSFSGLPLYQPIREVKCENTYKSQPDEGCKFDPYKVQKVLEGTLSNYLGNNKYNPVTCVQLVQSLTDHIRLKMKDINVPRYKLVCNVVLGQLNDQGILIVSRCLWDTSTDNYATATFKNTSLFAVATVYGIYFE